MEPTASFGYMLRRRRKALDLTQAELARQVGCVLTTIKKIETDARRPSRPLAERLAQILRVPPADRETFVRAARAELAADRLGIPDRPLESDWRTPAPMPFSTARLLGRAQECAAIAGLLRGGARLVTLTGPGGVGKTALAAHAGALMRADFAGRVYFVDLAALTDPALVLDTVARAIGIAQPGGDPLAALRAKLRGQPALLLLDNFEQVAAAAPALAELLAAAPGAAILATSRVPLRLQAEREFPVQPLVVPPAEAPLERAAQSPAVQLFVERMQAIRPDLALTAESAPAISAICRRLDGLPLAIVLAAARTRALTPPALLRRLDLALLSDGPRDIPDRQRTLHATLAWSERLLPGRARALFATLGVFSGGASLAAIEAVAGDPAGAVLESIETLVTHSLLIQHAGRDGEPYYTMLEPIRAYAAEQLSMRADAPAVRRRHALFFAELASIAEPHLYGAGQRAWVDLLVDSQDNLRAALTWMSGQAAELGLRLAGSLGWFWHFQGSHREGYDWLVCFLAQASGAGDQIKHPHAKALNQAGYLAVWLHDLPQAHELLSRSVAAWRKLGEPAGLAHALCDTGAALFHQGRYGEARTVLEECISLFRAPGQRHGLVRGLFWHGLATAYQGDFAAAQASAEECLALGRIVGDISNIAAVYGGILAHIAARQGDYRAAQAHTEESLRLSREAEDRPGIALAQGGLASMLLQQGQALAAQALMDEALQIWRGFGNRPGIARCLYLLGYSALQQQQPEHAAARFAESLALRQQLANPTGVAQCLIGLAEAARAAGRHALAARCLGATQALLNSQPIDLATWDLTLAPMTSERALAGEIAAARTALGDAAFTAAWSDGQRLSVDQLVAEALTPAR